MKISYTTKRRSPNWRGGTTKIGKYLSQICYGHPYANRDGYVPQHRLVMEIYLERFLEPGEIVHHIDGNRMNNEIDNLELCLHGVHSRYHKKGIPTNRKPENNGSYLLIKRKCLYCKQYDYRRNLFISSINRTAYHRDCKRNYEKNRRANMNNMGSASQMPE